jgi:hypothetical protein
LGFLVHHDAYIETAHEVKRRLAIVNDGMVSLQGKIVQLCYGILPLFKRASLTNHRLVTRQMGVGLVELSVVG